MPNGLFANASLPCSTRGESHCTHGALYGCQQNLDRGGLGCAFAGKIERCPSGNALLAAGQYLRSFTSYKSQKHSFGICSAQLIASSAKAWA